MSRRTENQGFACAHCGRNVAPLSSGSYRNHCPFCLYSLHLDETPGDRRSTCGGEMEPVGLRPSAKGWQIVHRCRRCGLVRANRAAMRDPQADDIEAICALMRSNAEAAAAGISAR